MADIRSPQKRRLIENSFLFAHIDEIVVERIVSDQSCRLEVYDKGAVIFDETHFQRCLGTVLSGSVRVEKATPDGQYFRLSTLGPGESFGAAVLFSSRERYPTVLTAEAAAEVLFIPEERIRWAMRRDFTITENYIRYLSDRVWFLNGKISSLTAGSVEQRLAMFLLEHSGGGQYSGPMTGLGRQLNISRASLYRAMDAMASRGLIRRDRKTICILDPAGLSDLADTKS